MTQALFRPAASADLEEAFAWYEAQHPGLGQAFRDAVEGALALIVENPQACPVLYRDTRRALLQRFPYGVFYRLIGDHVVVIACAHAKRHPRAWRSRR